MPSIQGNLFGMDLLISSGDQVESYLSYAAHHVPLVIENKQPCDSIYKIKELLLCSYQEKT